MVKMGKIITVSTKLIIPTEDDLKKERLRQAFIERRGRNKSTIFPAREHPEKKGVFLVLDGHHRCTIDDIFEGKSSIFVVESPKDIMLYSVLSEKYQFMDLELLREMNENIKYRFNEVGRLAFKKNHPESFEQLREQYYFLKDAGTAEKYFTTNSLNVTSS